MGIHVYIETVLFQLAQGVDSVRYEFLVVYAWTGVFECLPWNYVTYAIVAEGAETGEVRIECVGRKGTTRVADATVLCVVVEVCGELRWSIVRYLGICEIYATESLRGSKRMIR